MKIFTIIFFLVFQFPLFAQWSTLLNSPFSGRTDDICFVNDSVGWMATGADGRIYKTDDGGDSWTLQYFENTYLRSIEFATPLLGFCGSLNGKFLKTENGGNTWTNVANGIQPKPPGICGISAPTQEVIYGCGIWSSPAFVVKSVDGGNSWTYTDMSHLASSLIDVHFISADTGFVCGRAIDGIEGGIILHTVNGGESWTVQHKTMTPFDIVWKLQSPDGKNYFASIDAIPGSGNLRILNSKDSGMNWEPIMVRNTFIYSQVVGFIDSLTGWVGGRGNLFETIDGGVTWSPIILGADYNRFVKVNDNLAFMSGNRIYKYTGEGTVSTENPEFYSEIHSLKVSPNPASDYLIIEIELSNPTYCKLQIYSSDGQLMHDFLDGNTEKGVKNYSFDLSKIAPQTLFVTLKTNEGLIYKKVIKM